MGLREKSDDRQVAVWMGNEANRQRLAFFAYGEKSGGGGF